MLTAANDAGRNTMVKIETCFIARLGAGGF